MVLDLLMFFAPFLIGGLANPIVAKAGDRTLLLPLAAIMVFLGYEILAFHVRFMGLQTELFVTLAGALQVILIVLSLPVDDKQRNAIETTWATKVGSLCFLLIPVAAFTPVGRVAKAQQMAAQFEGTVTRKYHSNNHNEPSLVVAQIDGSFRSLENVDKQLWASAIEGHSHLKKSPWSAFGQLDGQNIRVVPPGSVMFLSPFPD